MKKTILILMLSLSFGFAKGQSDRFAKMSDTATNGKLITKWKVNQLLQTKVSLNSSIADVGSINVLGNIKGGWLNIANSPNTDSSPTQFLTRNPVTGEIMITPNLSFYNGLTKIGSNISLGGALTNNVIIGNFIEGQPVLGIIPTAIAESGLVRGAGFTYGNALTNKIASIGVSDDQAYPNEYIVQFGGSIEGIGGANINYNTSTSKPALSIQNTYGTGIQYTSKQNNLTNRSLIDKEYVDSLGVDNVKLNPSSTQSGAISVAGQIKSETRILVNSDSGNVTLGKGDITLGTMTGGGSISPTGINLGSNLGGIGLTTTQLTSVSNDQSHSLQSGSWGFSWRSYGSGVNIDVDQIVGYKSTSPNFYRISSDGLSFTKNANSRQILVDDVSPVNSSTNFWPNRDGILATIGDITDSIASSGLVKKTGDIMTGDLILASATPSNALSAVPKSYIDNAITGISWKNSARVASVVNLALSGLGTVDGITLANGNRVLVKNQTDQTQNGIYIASSGSWTRALDADDADELNQATVAITLGTTQKNTQWTATTTITSVGVDPVNFTQISGAGTYAPGNNIALSGNVFSTVANPTFGTIIGSLNGNASTATSLANTRTIFGQNFNGTANVTGTLTGVTDINASGNIGVGASSLSGVKAYINTNSTNAIGLLIRGVSGQTANLQEWQNSSGVNQAFMFTDGSLRTPYIGNTTTANNSKISLNVNGASVERNISDASPTLTVNSLLGTGSIQAWQQGSSTVAFVNNTGLYGGTGIYGISGINNSYINTASSGTSIIRNIADSNPALIINNQSGTGAIAEFRQGNSAIATVWNNGQFFGSGIGNILNVNNSQVLTSSTGTVIRSSKANSDNVLTINNQNGSSTGLLLDAQFNSSRVASIDRSGVFNSSSLTANTILKSDGSKNIVSATASDVTALTAVIDATTTAYTSSTLNSTYPNVAVGVSVYCRNITGGGLVYVKQTEAGSSDVWISQPITIVP